MILVIDNYDSFTYNLVQLLLGLEQEVVVRRNDVASVPELLALEPDANVPTIPGTIKTGRRTPVFVST